MANAHAVVNLDSVKAIYTGSIYNVKHSSAMENGSLINIGALETGESELCAVSVPATATLASARVALVATDEVMYQRYNSDGTIADKGDFVNAANAVSKAYDLEVGDRFTITDDGFTGTAVVGKYLIPADGVLTGAISDTIGSTRFSAIVEKVGITSLTYDGDSATRFRVVKA
jgi:hypothetical protein